LTTIVIKTLILKTSRKKAIHVSPIPTCPATFTMCNARPPALPPLSTLVISGVQRLLGANYAPGDVRMDLALLIFPAKTSGVICHLVVGPPHDLAKKVGEEALNV
jgi:hypothetical protein